MIVHGFDPAFRYFQINDPCTFPLDESSKFDFGTKFGFLDKSSVSIYFGWTGVSEVSFSESSGMLNSAKSLLERMSFGKPCLMIFP